MWPELERRMRDCIRLSDGDQEAGHQEADKLLVEALHMASGDASAEFRRLYEEVGKWYA